MQSLYLKGTVLNPTGTTPFQPLNLNGLRGVGEGVEQITKFTLGWRVSSINKPLLFRRHCVHSTTLGWFYSNRLRNVLTSVELSKLLTCPQETFVCWLTDVRRKFVTASPIQYERFQNPSSFSQPKVWFGSVSVLEKKRGFNSIYVTQFVIEFGFKSMYICVCPYDSKILEWTEKYPFCMSKYKDISHNEPSQNTLIKVTTKIIILRDSSGFYGFTLVFLPSNDPSFFSPSWFCSLGRTLQNIVEHFYREKFRPYPRRIGTRVDKQNPTGSSSLTPNDNNNKV